MNMKFSASKSGIIAKAVVAGVWPSLVGLAAYSIFWHSSRVPGRIRECLGPTSS
ncbi:MAG: hypothetical protein ABSG04_17010 [Verrucomicrobiota bacterium]